jgi:hypothetical protein
VKCRRIGVWLSLALVVFALSAWAGSKIGTKVAVYRFYSSQKKSSGALSASEHAHLELVLEELSTAGLLRLPFLLSPRDDKLKKILPDQVEDTERFRQRVKTVEAKSAVEMDLAFDNVITAMAEEQISGKEQAARYMESAQSLFQSLGWKDYSENTLREVVNRDLHRWN